MDENVIEQGLNSELSKVVNESTDNDFQRPTEGGLQEDSADNVISISEHGLTDGVFNVNPIHFQDFLINDTANNVYDYEINYKHQRLRISTEFFAETIGKELDLQSKVFYCEAFIEGKSKKIKLLEERIMTKSNERASLQERLNSGETDCSIVSAIIYTVAAVIFIIADFGISMSIVADTLDMRDLDGVMFALGLASISILLKPLYDRLIETEYLKGDFKKRFNVVILVTSAIALCLLVVLGIYRFDANSAAQQLAFLSDKDEPYESLFRIQQDIVSSPFGMISFIVSGFLFAIAGTICLGIALPVFQRKWQENKHRRNRNRLSISISTLENEVQELSSDVFKTDADKKTSMHTLSLIQSSREIAENIQKLEDELSVLIKEKSQFLSKKRVALFMDAYERGTKMALSSDSLRMEALKGIRKAFSERPDSERNIILPDSAGNATNAGRYSKTRPFIAIRKIIAADFRNLVNNQTDENIIDYTTEL